MEFNICPKCKRPLRNINTYHYCEEVAIDDLFVNKPDDVVLAFDKLFEHVAAFDQIAVSGTKKCIVFVRNKTFLVAKPMVKFLEIKFYSSEAIDDEDLYKCQMWNSKYEGVIRLKNENELSSKFLNYIHSSYLIS